MTDKNTMVSEILKAARSIFGQYGFKKTTIEDIAVAIHRGKSSLYYYFDSKEDILAGVISMETAMLKKELAEVLAEADILERFRRYFIIRALMLGRLPNLAAVFYDGYYNQYPAVKKIKDDFLEHEKILIAGLIRDGMGSGIFDLEEAETTSLAVVATLRSFEFQWALNPDFKRTEKNINELVRIFFFGLVKR